MNYVGERELPIIDNYQRCQCLKTLKQNTFFVTWLPQSEPDLKPYPSQRQTKPQVAVTGSIEEVFKFVMHSFSCRYSPKKVEKNINKSLTSQENCLICKWNLQYALPVQNACQHPKTSNDVIIFNTLVCELLHWNFWGLYYSYVRISDKTQLEFLLFRLETCNFLFTCMKHLLEN